MVFLTAEEVEVRLLAAQVVWVAVAYDQSGSSSTTARWSKSEDKRRASSFDCLRSVLFLFTRLLNDSEDKYGLADTLKDIVPTVYNLIRAS